MFFSIEEMLFFLLYAINAVMCRSRHRYISALGLLSFAGRANARREWRIDLRGFDRALQILVDRRYVGSVERRSAGAVEREYWIEPAGVQALEVMIRERKAQDRAGQTRERAAANEMILYVNAEFP